MHSALYKLARLRQEILQQHRNISSREYHMWEEIGSRIRDGPVEVQPLASFVQDASEAIKQCVASHSMSDDHRMVVERGIIINGELPDTWTPVFESIFDHALPTLLKAVNGGTRIFSAPDYWQTSPNERLVNGTSGPKRVVDVIRKTPLTDDGGPLRQCVRCKSMTDIAPGQRPDCHALGNLTKACICGGAWALLNKTDRVH